jgi:hypothetical protein
MVLAGPGGGFMSQLAYILLGILVERARVDLSEHAAPVWVHFEELWTQAEELHDGGIDFNDMQRALGSLSDLVEDMNGVYRFRLVKTSQAA